MPLILRAQCLRLGTVLSSLKEFEDFYFVKFWKREARTVEAAQKRVNRYLSPGLKYYQLKYACIHGGQAFRAKGKGQRSAS